MILNKILCAVDLSDQVVNAIEYAKTLAKNSNAQIELVSVAPHPTYYVGLRTFHDSNEEMQEKITEAYAPLLKEFAAKNFPGMQVKTTLLYGDPATELINYCQKKEWDLLVMATHSRVGLDRILLGSVAHKVVSMVDMPVLTIRPSL